MGSRMGSTLGKRARFLGGSGTNLECTELAPRPARHSGVRMLGVAAAAALMLLASASAGAQPSTVHAPSPADLNREAAKQLVEAGIAAQSAQDYDRAITLYEQAFALAPHPTLVFDIAQAHRLAGRSEQALRHYERYLSLAPNGSQAAMARAIVATVYFDAAIVQGEQGRRLDARRSLERGLQYGKGVLGADQLDEARRQLMDMERRLGRIRVICRSEATTVRLDGATLFTGPGVHEEWVEPRAHALTVERPGHGSEPGK